MIASYYAGTTPTEEEIEQIDTWMGSRFGYHLTGDNPSSPSGNDLATLAKEYDWSGLFGIAGFQLPTAQRYANWHISQLQQELAGGYPVIVAVYTTMDPDFGHKHFMVLVGMDDNFVYVNDPGKNDPTTPTDTGASVTACPAAAAQHHRCYTISDFIYAWQQNANNAVVVIHPNAIVPGTASFQATLDGSTWSGPIGYTLTCAGQSVNGTAVPQTLANETPGTCSISNVSGGPPNSTFTSVTPSASQTLGAGATIAYTLNYTSNPISTVGAAARLDASGWSGAVSYSIGCTGQSLLSETAIPLQPTSAPAGECTLSYGSGGPANSTLSGIAPCGTVATCMATLAAGQTLTFTLQFKSNPPTAGFTMTSGGQSATDGQTLNVSLGSGGTISVTFDGTGRSVAVNGGAITGWQWTIDGSVVSTAGTFSQPLTPGTHPVSLVVTDSRGAQSQRATGTVAVAVPTATVTISATLDGQAGPPGPFSYSLTGPSGPMGNLGSLPVTLPNTPVGSYALSYIAGAPANSTFVGISPCAIVVPASTNCMQAVGAGQALSFILQFRSNPPTAGFTMTSGGQSATDGQSLNVVSASGAAVNVAFDGTGRSGAFNGATITSWQWAIDGNVVAATSTFSQSVATGAHGVSLTVTDSRGAQSQPATGTVVVTTSGLDSGPWPTQDHDNRRSNQSSLSGPASAGTPQLIYDAGTPILSELVITSDGKLVLGGFSQQVVANHVVAIDATGKAAWPAPFTLIANNNESPIGFTVDASGRIYVSTHDWPDIPGPVEVHLYALLPNGTSAPNWPISFYPALYEPPALAADGTIYQMDELTNLRALRPTDGSTVWEQTLAGFSQGAIALDSAGNLYAGTDGGRYGGKGFWSFSPGGILRWSLLSDNLGTPVVSPADVIYVASQTGTVYAFNPSGTLLPGWPFSSGASPPSDSQQDPLAVGGSGTVYLKTVSGVFAINPNGTKKWSYSPGGDGSLSTVVILDSDENAYFAFGNTVYSVTSSGDLRWSVPLNAPGRLFLGGSGILYVIASNQRLYAIASGQ